jgi:hypothetical protein
VEFIARATARGHCGRHGAPRLPQHRYCIVPIVAKRQERELRSEADCLSKVTEKALIEDHEGPAAQVVGVVFGPSAAWRVRVIGSCRGILTSENGVTNLQKRQPKRRLIV